MTGSYKQVQKKILQNPTPIHDKNSQLTRDKGQFPELDEYLQKVYSEYHT